MSTRTRVVAFVLTLAVVFLGARGLGAVVGENPDLATATMEHGEEGVGHDALHTTDPGAAASHLPDGLQVSDQGYTLRVIDQRPFRFRIDGPDGHPVTAYDEVHDQPLHLIAVRRDGTGYQHVHPRLEARGATEGTWTARLDLTPGSHRVFADFTAADGPALVLGTDVEVAGDYQPAPAPAPTRTDRVDDYRVTLAGDLTVATASPLTARITRDGRPVTDLQPFLGAHGHLVALREGDLAYLHVHPEEAESAGPEVRFVAEIPSAGRYRLFLDFQHRDVVRTAAFVVGAEETAHEH